MDHAIAPPRPLASERAPWLRGRLALPGDPAIGRLALIVAAVARGETVIEALPESSSVLETARAVAELGAGLRREGGEWRVRGLGPGVLLAPEAPLAFSCMDGLGPIMGLLCLQRFESRFAADPASPLAASIAPLPALLRGIGSAVRARDGDRLPVTLCGPPTPLPVHWRGEIGSAAEKAALLLAGIGLPGIASIEAPAWLPDHAERLLAAFGAEVGTGPSAGGRLIEVAGLPELTGRRLRIPADPGLAAFAMVAATIVPGSELVLEDVLVNPTRSGAMDTLLEMGAEIEVLSVRPSGGEDLAELRVRHARLTGVEIPEERVRGLGDEWAALAIAAAHAEGRTVFRGGAHIQAGQGQRLAAMLRGLRANGVAAGAEDGCISVSGSGRVPGGGRVETLMDPVVAMAFLVMGMAADDAVTIDDRSALASGFADFVSRFEDIGASFIHYTD